MINNKKVLAIIPARGGSKGLPNKNILPLAGKALIGWTIEVGLSSKYIDKLIVSTDSDEIAEVAKSFNCDVPFIRPADISSDKSPTIDVLMHTINYYREMNEIFDYLILLEPTSPLRELSDIDIPLEKLEETREFADSIVGVCKVESSHPSFSVVLDDNDLIKPYASNNFSVLRRQDLNELFFFEGSIYISDITTLIKKKTFYHDRTLPHIVPRWKSIEIDEISDLIAAEAYILNKDKLG